MFATPSIIDHQSILLELLKERIMDDLQYTAEKARPSFCISSKRLVL